MLGWRHTAALLTVGLVLSTLPAHANGRQRQAHAQPGDSPTPRCWRHAADARQLRRNPKLRLDGVRVSLPPSARPAGGDPGSKPVVASFGLHPIAAPGWYTGDAGCVAGSNRGRHSYECEFDNDGGWFSLVELKNGGLKVDIVSVTLAGPNGSIEIGPNESSDRSFTLSRRKLAACR